MSDMREQFAHTMYTSMVVEVETGITFAQLALSTSSEATRGRNRRNARKAYDVAVRYYEKLPHEGTVAESRLLAQIKKLRDMLLKLGEHFEE